MDWDIQRGKIMYYVIFYYYYYYYVIFLRNNRADRQTVSSVIKTVK